TAPPLGNRLSATVLPSTATFADPFTSTSVKNAPSCVFHTRMNGQSTSTPQICVPQFSSPATIWAFVRTPGDEYATDGQSTFNASASSTVSVEFPVNRRAPDCVTA